MTMRRRARLGAGLAAALLTVLTGVLLAANPAQAHASLVGSSPAHGAQVDEAPGEVRLRFTERVTVAPGGVALLDATGAAVPTGPAEIPAGQPDEVRLPLPPDLADGTYLVSWRVVSADSHPIAGAVVFTVGDRPPQEVTAAGAGTDPLLSALFMLARWAGYAGLALFAGALLVFLWCWPGGWAHPRAQRVLRTGWAASVAAAAVVLLLQGPYAAGRSLVAVADPALLAGTLQTDFGRYVLARLALLAAAVVVVFGSPMVRRARLRAAVALPLAVALAVTWVGTGHTNTTGRWVDAAIDTAHLGAMAAWFGGLALLAVCLLPRSSTMPAAELTGVLRRFSLLATGSVVTLIGTGGYLAWRQVGSLDGLVGTTYGRLLAFKLAAIGVLLWLGAMSRSVVQRRAGDTVPEPAVRSRSARRAARAAEQRSDRDRAQLRQSVRLEAGTAVVVLVIASVLVATPPATVVTATAGQPLAAAPVPQQEVLPDGGTVSALVDPGWTGRNRLTVSVRDPSGAAWDVPEVTAALLLPDQDLGPLAVPLVRTGAGAYESGEVELPLAGVWLLRVSVRTSEIDSNTVAFEVPVS
jgi:copper transport protein